MESNKDAKRKKDKQSDEDDYRKEKKSKRARTRSRSRSPAEAREKHTRRKRRHSRSKSYERPVKHERQRDEISKEDELKKEAAQRKARETDMLNTRTGGAYIPPARLRMMQAQITDKSSTAYQRLAWEALKKSIHGHINKINVGNIGIIIKELLKENIVRGRGLLCRSVIQAQAASPTFTNVYAALVSAVNSRFPNIGELLLKRLVIQFKRGFKRNDKPICISSASFIAHLVNQRVAHEILALELLTLLVETPTDDSVEVAIAFLKECGQKLTEVSSKGVNAIFEMLRNILHEGQLDKRVQYMIEVMFQVWKDGFKDHPALLDDLELVPEEEQFTHLLMLDDATDPQDILNVFKFDEKYEENEQKYKTLTKEILGSDAESEGEDGSGESGSEESDDEEDGEEAQKEGGMTIIDNTETNLVALRRTIYLTINSSLDFEECAHKLMKMQLKPGQEVELCHMFLDCCAEQRTYEKFYGLLAQRFCNINRIYIGPFEEIFKDSYATAHRLDTNRLRNVSKFFAHLLFTDSISWEVLECVKLNEEDTTSSSRIYIKILFQELAEYMGLKKLNDRLKDPTLQEAFLGVFPRDNPKNTRFSINFFTSIGLGGLTDELREHLKQMPKNVPAPITEINVGSESSSSDSSSSSSSSDNSSSSDSSSDDSEDEGSSRKNKSDKTKITNDKSPKTPEDSASQKNTDRWGHDGFYETYGKDARRTESRPDRNERDKDNFVRPRDVRQNPDFNHRRNADEQRSGDSRRNDDGRKRDYSRQEEDNSRRRNPENDRRRDRDGDREDSRRSNRDNSSNRDEDRGDRNGDKENSRRSDRDGGRNRQEDRRDRDEAKEDRRSYRDDSRNREDDRRRDRDRDRDDSRRNSQDGSRNREHDRRRDRDNRDADMDAFRRSTRDDDDRDGNASSFRKDERERDREQRNDDDIRQKSDRKDVRSKETEIRVGGQRNVVDNRNKSDNDDNSNKNRTQIISEVEQYSDKGKCKEKSSKEDSRKKDREESDSEEEQKTPKASNKKKSSKEEKRKKNKVESCSEEEHKNEKDINRKKSGKQDQRKKDKIESDCEEEGTPDKDIIKKKGIKKGRHKNREADSSEEETRNKDNNNEKKSDREGRKKKVREKESSDEEYARNYGEKENRNKKIEKKRERDALNSKGDERKKKSSENDSSEEDSNRKKRDKDKRKNKENAKHDKKSHSDHEKDDGWDIKTGTSIRGEAASGRYWDN